RQHLVHVEHIVHRFVPVGTGCAGGVTRRRPEAHALRGNDLLPTAAGGMPLTLHSAARTAVAARTESTAGDVRTRGGLTLGSPGQFDGPAAGDAADAAVVTAVVVPIRRTGV